jgi:hypothetical protein
MSSNYVWSFTTVTTTNNASGTYTYDSLAGILTLNFTSSDFPVGCGPRVGTDQFTVSITPTTMIWAGENDEMTWTRDNGTSGDIVGVWVMSQDENTYEAFFGSDGSFTLIGHVRCGGGEGEGDISMITPYVNESDMGPIYEAFSSDASVPWGFEHNGIDFFPKGNLKPFQAVSSGVVVNVMLWENDKSSHWQVNVIIEYNSTYAVEYAFEPMTKNQADGETQLANISVSVGQVVSQGDIIGYLYTAGELPHVHFSLYKNASSICPEPYFTPDARESILNLLYLVWPDANMCY